MGIFWRKDKIIDLTEYSRRQREKVDSLKQEINETKKEEAANSGGFFSFFSGVGASNSNANASANTNVENSSDSEGSPDEKRRRLAKRLADMTSRIEDLSNQIYHLQQRLELLERKIK